MLCLSLPKNNDVVTDVQCSGDVMYLVVDHFNIIFHLQNLYQSLTLHAYHLRPLWVVNVVMYWLSLANSS